MKRGTYRDSITLLRTTKEVAALPGIRQAVLVMATPLNMRVLAETGFKDPQLKDAGTDDLIIALEAENEASMTSALRQADDLLIRGVAQKQGARMPRSIQEAVASMPDANLAVISVPGSYAKREGLAALRAGLNVFMFSSNVPKPDEKELKQLALEKGLLMMGPDCGTALINNTVLGFGNAVRSGGIGLVSASGTGLQEVATLIHKNGQGVSQGIGTGGGDLSDAVGGIMTLEGLRLLEEDARTKVIVVVSKPPGPRTLKAVLAKVRSSRKPVVITFLGARLRKSDLGKQSQARTLEEAAAVACRIIAPGGTVSDAQEGDIAQLAFKEAQRLSPTQKYVRGIYAGGTLCTEAQVVLAPLVGKVRSNAPFDQAMKVDGSSHGQGHTCIDMGADEFVVGRAHPMIDFTLRRMRIIQEAKDPQAAVLLLDVELGIGSNADPAGELVPAIGEAKEICVKAGRYLSVVCSVVGTDGDSQGLDAQKAKLMGAGVIITGSNARAASLAALISSRGETLGSRGGAP